MNATADLFRAASPRPLRRALLVALTVTLTVVSLLLTAAPAPAAEDLAAPGLARRSAVTRAGQLGLRLTKAAEGVRPLCPGNTFLYRLILENLSDPDTGPQPAFLLDPIPGGVTYVAGSVTGGGLFNAATGRIEWTGVLAPGQSRTVTFLVLVGVPNPDLPGAGTIVNRAEGGIASLAGEVELVVVLDDCPAPPPQECLLTIDGKVEDTAGNGTLRYPVANARVWAYDLGALPLPLAPLSQKARPPAAEAWTNATNEAQFSKDRFAQADVARYGFQAAYAFGGEAGGVCPPRLAVASLLWSADNLFAVATDRLIDARYVPLYLARCLSNDPRDLPPSGPCRAWTAAGPNTWAAPDFDFTFGTSPASAESARVIGLAGAPASEEWLAAGGDFDALMRDGAHSYFWTCKAMRYFQDVAAEIGVGLEPAVVLTHDPGGTRAQRRPVSFGDLREPNPPPPPLAAVRISEADSEPADGDKPDNREWHELGHYWNLVLYEGDWPGGGPWTLPGCNSGATAGGQVPWSKTQETLFGVGNHCGYANASTADSYIEGFAEFTAMILGERWGDPRPFIYHFEGGQKNLEMDYRVWGSTAFGAAFDPFGTMIGFKTRHTFEEFAAAGVLWDFHDGGNLAAANVREEKAPGVVSNLIRTEDRLSLGARAIFGLIHDRHAALADLADLHTVFGGAHPQNTDGAGDAFSDVDEIFIAHAAFNDVIDRNLRHDAGEAVGPTGSLIFPLRPARKAVPEIANAWVLAHYETASGLPLDPVGIRLEIDVQLDEPYSYYGFEEEVPAATELRLELPPTYFPSRARIVAVGPDGARSLPFVLSGDAFWEAVGNGEPHAAEHTFRLGEGGTGCVPSPTRLCLGGRFGVEVTWRTFRGETGSGHAELLTGDTGTFWFFRPTNVELLVKALDACTFNDRFWIFAAGLTDVEVEITVTDTAAGESRTYLNPQQTPFEPILDTDAFATCGTAGVGLGGPAAFFASGLDLPGSTPAGSLPAALDRTAGEGLLLGGDRFRVEVAWRTNQGTSGAGHGVELTDASGVFWFFRQDNVELMIKVHDACSFNDRFWVFVAGLTDVEVEIDVLDTATGVERRYVNPQKTPFAPILDTSAFATCG